jgi:hypothetical protein
MNAENINISTIVTMMVATLIVYFFYHTWQKRHRQDYIDRFEFPSHIKHKVLARYPHLTPDDATLVLETLRDYFGICQTAGIKMVAMPSQVVDVAWHEFILFTRLYKEFCRKSFGRFLHHTPAEAMTTPTQAQLSIKRAWRIACHRENISPKTPVSLPMIFAIDTLLKIPDGFAYSLNCQTPGNQDYCGSHIGCSSGCSGGCSGGDSGCSGGGGCGGD